MRCWAKKFATKRAKLKSIILHGEAGAVDHEKIKEGITKMKNIIADFDEENVYNMDETGLFYRLLPRKSYVFKGTESRMRGKKGMKAKDRLSLYVATNLTGSQKVPLAIIGTSANPRCFRLTKKLPFTYFSQKKAWSDTATYRLWFS
jgi:hypothetical protein